MDSEYDEATARHYAAYRPPLHERILRPVLGRLPRFKSALDIGCGTGHSTVALVPFAEEVVGTDASKYMVDAANELWAGKVLFVSDAAHPISWTFQNERFDLFTLAGSLSYLDSEETLEDIQSMAERGARVVVYDFDVDLSAVYRRLRYSDSPSGYRHDAEFPESERLGFKRQLKVRSQLNFTATSAELAHLLLSVKDFRLWAGQTFGDDDKYAKLVAVLGDDAHTLTAKTWCSLFAFRG